MSKADDNSDILATASISGVRRWLTIIPGIFAGALLAWYGLNAPFPQIWVNVFAVVVGLVMALGASWLLSATSRGIYLTPKELRDINGALIARISDMKKLERETISYKPAHGFIIVLAEPARSHWSPGVWWRTGQRVGVGGFLHADQTKAMAGAIRSLIAQCGSTNR